MKRFFWGVAALLLLCALPVAQLRAQQTVVTGTVKDPNGIPYANATVQEDLQISGGPATVTINNQAQCTAAGAGTAPCQIPINGHVNAVSMDATGTFQIVLYSNTSITPASSKWLFSVNISPGIPLPLGTGPQMFQVAITITGATQNVSATLSAAAPSLTNFTGGAGSCPGTAVSPQIFWDNAGTCAGILGSAVTTTGAITLTAGADTTTPMTISAHSATQSVAEAIVSMNSSDTCLGQFCVRGPGLTNTFSGIFPGLSDFAANTPLAVNAFRYTGDANGEYYFINPNSSGIVATGVALSDPTDQMAFSYQMPGATASTWSFSLASSKAGATFLLNLSSALTKAIHVDFTNGIDEKLATPATAVASGNSVVAFAATSAGASATVPTSTFENNDSAACISGVVCVGGDGIGSVVGFPAVFAIETNNDTPWSFGIHNRTAASAGSGFVAYVNSTGFTSLANTDNSGLSSSVVLNPGTDTLSLQTAATISSAPLEGPAYLTATNCANGATPAVCGSAASGAVAVPTGSTPTLQINTTAVTATSRIFLAIDESATISGVTCNTTLSTLVQPVVTARTPGASFTIQINATLAVNKACVSYWIVN